MLASAYPGGEMFLWRDGEMGARQGNLRKAGTRVPVRLWVIAFLVRMVAVLMNAFHHR
jgi:hypothetical protein